MVYNGVAVDDSVSSGVLSVVASMGLEGPETVVDICTKVV